MALHFPLRLVRHLLWGEEAKFQAVLCTVGFEARGPSWRPRVVTGLSSQSLSPLGPVLQCFTARPPGAGLGGLFLHGAAAGRVGTEVLGEVHRRDLLSARNLHFVSLGPWCRRPPAPAGPRGLLSERKCP